MSKNINEMTRSELVAARTDTDDPAVIGRINKRLADLAADDHAAERRAELLTAVQNGVTSPEALYVSGRGEGEDYEQAFRKYLRRGYGDLTQRERVIMDDGYRSLEGAERRALTTTTGSSGGFTVPTEMLSSIVAAQAAFGGIRRAGVNIINTDDGRDLEWPTSDDTGNQGELITENTSASEQDVVFGQKVLKAWLWSSKLIKLPLTLVEDSAFDIVSHLGGVLGERIGRAQASYLITGTGSSQPEGIVTNVTTGWTTPTGQTTSLTYDDFVEMEASIDGAYLPRAEWVISRGVLRQLRLIKDQQDNPIMTRATEREPASILGYPFTVDDNMATVAATNKPVIFGDLSKYTIRDVISFELVVLRERYAEARQLGALGWARMDARPTTAGDNPYKALVMAAS